MLELPLGLLILWCNLLGPNGIEEDIAIFVLRMHCLFFFVIGHGMKPSRKTQETSSPKAFGCGDPIRKKIHIAYPLAWVAMISSNALSTNSSSSLESPKVLSLNWRVRPGLMPQIPRSLRSR